MSQRKTYTVQLTDAEVAVFRHHSVHWAVKPEFNPVAAPSLPPQPPTGAVEVRVPVTMSDDGDVWSACGSSIYSDEDAAERAIELLADKERETHVVTLVAHVMPPERRKVPEVVASVEEVKP